MGTKLFVGGLSWGTDDGSLKTSFERFGTVVEARVIVDRDTGRSKGFGFVTFETEEAANEARQQMDGSTLDGRTIRVNEAQDKGGSGPRRGPPRGGHSRGHSRGRGPGGPPPVVHTRGGGRYEGSRGGSEGGEDRRGGGPGRRPPPRGAPGRSGPGRGGPGRGGPGREGGGFNRGPNPRDGGVGFGAPPEDSGWEEKTEGRKRKTKKKKRGGPRDDEFRTRNVEPRRGRRESGRSWRDYSVEDDDE